MRCYPPIRQFWWICIWIPSAHLHAQNIPANKAWKPVVEQAGLSIKYIHYPKANGQNGGVVALLHNMNPHGIRYEFTLVFRAQESEAFERVEGVLGPGEAKTGDSDGLFWIPFTDDRSISEIGISGLKILPDPDRL